MNKNIKIFLKILFFPIFIIYLSIKYLREKSLKYLDKNSNIEGLSKEEKFYYYGVIEK